LDGRVERLAGLADSEVPAVAKTFFHRRSFLPNHSGVFLLHQNAQRYKVETIQQERKFCRNLFSKVR
jgi:hypothetical protein